MRKPLSLYFHVPFCARKCAYCDFASWPGREGDWRRYFEALENELKDWSEITDFGRLSDHYCVQTAFIGGGTPTLAPAEAIRTITDQSRVLFPFAEDAEITIEGNPGTLTPEKLAIYRSAGINRLSLGAQSFDDGLLKCLGRIHDAQQIGEAVRMARDAGFENINLDLMYALPGQTMEQWTDTLNAATALDVEHISAYSLIVEEGTPMAARVASGEAVLPDEDAVNAMQRAAIDVLARAGYGRYEISNYAKPGFECRHNRVYWRRGDYLGLGCAAHSMLQNCRFHNPEDLDDYLAGGQRLDRQRLDASDILEETVMLGTRTTQGIDFGLFSDADPVRLERLIKADLIAIEDGFLRLTRGGLELQDAVMLELLEVLGC